MSPDPAKGFEPDDQTSVTTDLTSTEVSTNINNEAEHPDGCTKWSTSTAHARCVSRQDSTEKCVVHNCNGSQIDWKRMKLKNELGSYNTLPDEYKEDHQRKQHSKLKAKLWTNIAALGFGLFLSGMCFLPCRNLQSSLFPGDLGNMSLISMAGASVVIYALSYVIDLSSKPKRTLALSAGCYILFAITNQYPSYFTLIPSAMSAGVFYALSSTATETLLSSYAAVYIAVSGLSYEASVRSFHIVVSIFIQSSQIFGNLFVGLLCPRDRKHLFLQFHADNSTTVVSKWDPRRDYTYSHTFLSHDFNFDESPDEKSLHVLLFALVVVGFLGCCVLMFILRNPDIIIKKSQTGNNCKAQIGSTTKYFILACHTPGMLYSGMQGAYVISDFLRVYCADCHGLNFVGYCMMVYGALQMITLISLDSMHSHGVCKYITAFMCYTSSFTLLMGSMFTGNCFRNSVVMLTAAGIWGFSDCTWHLHVKWYPFGNSGNRRLAVGKLCLIAHGFGFIALLTLEPYTTIHIRELFLLLVLVISGLGHILGLIGYKISQCRNNFAAAAV